jgi:2-oxoglutarate dehydrogenase E2 component (dihydrolipoamide succinyltransferase)
MKFIRTFESFNKDIEIKIGDIAGIKDGITITKWLIEEGGQVNKGDEICELETDKVSFDFSVEASGIIHILKKEGEMVKQGDTICLLRQDIIKEITDKF